MGVLNNTPDSFFDGDRYNNQSLLHNQIARLATEGADIIDIGGYSSRPGAANVAAEEEQRRVLEAIAIAQKVAPHIPLSVDTFRASVAAAAVDSGAAMVNDISGGNLDSAMFQTVAKLRVPYVLMHMKGTPQAMSELTHYDNLLTEITDYFVYKVNELISMGVNDIIIDPGFGFAKTSEQNYAILKNLNYFNVIKQPLLVGLSRKSMIYKALKITSEEALNGTTVLNTIALMNGVSILRVHDVKAAKEAITLLNLTNK